MPGETRRAQFEDGPAATAARPRQGTFGSEVDIIGIIAVDIFTGHAIGAGAVRIARHRSRFLLGCRNAPFIVLHHRDERQFHDADKVEHFVECPLVGGTIAKKRQRHAGAFLQPPRQRHAGRRPHAFGDDPRRREIHPRVIDMHMAALALAEPGLLAEQFSGHGIEIDPARDGDMVRTVIGGDHVVGIERRAHPGSHRLGAVRTMEFAGQRPVGKGEDRRLADPVKPDHRIIEGAAAHHLAIHVPAQFRRKWHGNPLRKRRRLTIERRARAATCRKC